MLQGSPKRIHSGRYIYPLSDSAYQDILAHLPTTTAFIRDALAESPDSRVMVSETYCTVTMYRVSSDRLDPV